METVSSFLKENPTFGLFLDSQAPVPLPLSFVSRPMVLPYSNVCTSESPPPLSVCVCLTTGTFSVQLIDGNFLFSGLGLRLLGQSIKQPPCVRETTKEE